VTEQHLTSVQPDPNLSDCQARVYLTPRILVAGFCCKDPATLLYTVSGGWWGPCACMFQHYCVASPAATFLLPGYQHDLIWTLLKDNAMALAGLQSMASY